MRIYQPARGVGAASRENSFIVVDDAGVQIGQAGIEYRMLGKMMEDRPLAIEMTMSAHPVAEDLLFGALMARAEQIRASRGVPARLFVRCAMNDTARKEYFLSMGFDDYDGLELFALDIRKAANRKKNYSPPGIKSIDVDLRTRARREEFLLSLKEYGAVEHAGEWLEVRMREPVFLAKAMYYGSDFAGEILVTGNQNEAVLQMICTEPNWRGRGVASAMIDEAVQQLSKQDVPYLSARCERRNKSAVRLFRRVGFDWYRTEEMLLGRDM